MNEFFRRALDEYSESPKEKAERELEAQRKIKEYEESQQKFLVENAQNIKEQREKVWVEKILKMLDQSKEADLAVKKISEMILKEKNSRYETFKELRNLASDINHLTTLSDLVCDFKPLHLKVIVGVLCCQVAYL